MLTTIEPKSIEELLRNAKDNIFVIPEYQRPYAWTDEQAKTLFDDILNFTDENQNNETKTYFLGSIVSYENENREQEIIDGQQRLTSILLLLRAIYTKLKSTSPSTEYDENFIKRIEPLIWKQDKLTGKTNYSKALLTSRVITTEREDILKNILETGIVKIGNEDNYSKNYLLFQKLFDNLALDSPFIVYYFILSLLEKTILLPIKADNQETALTIFSTLNDRGLPLSDADIFKAKIYNNLKDGEKEKFIEEWKNLAEDSSYVGESIQQLFYYYMFYLRALENDKISTTPGVRKYYSKNKFQKLFDKNLLNELNTILNIWRVINKREELDDEIWSRQDKLLKLLDILSSYPNEFWKYPVIIYYLKYKENKDFIETFERFLKKLIQELATNYIVSPTINAVKSEILRLNTEIIVSSMPIFSFKTVDNNEIKEKLRIPNRNITRMLLKILAYTEQDDLLVKNWEIEHIFPRKWHNNYFINHSKEEVERSIEYLGNKVPFEKKLNIQAGNGYFGKKKEEYRKSKIEITKKLSNISKSEWEITDIIERGVEVTNTLIKELENYSKEYEIFRKQ